MPKRKWYITEEFTAPITKTYVVFADNEEEARMIFDTQQHVIEVDTDRGECSEYELTFAEEVWNGPGAMED